MRDGIVEEIVVPKARKVRGMHSKSEAFEEGYARFLADTIGRDIRSVQLVESETAKMLVMAGCRRVVLTKRTGLLHMEQLVGPYFGAGDEQWSQVKLLDVKFWASTNALTAIVQSAWGHRIGHFVPPPEVCFPDRPKDSKWMDVASDGGPEEYVMSAKAQWNTCIDLAAKRRIGVRDNANAIAKTMVCGLWKFLTDASLLRTCIAFFGNHAELIHYNVTVKRRRELMARIQETPSLAPLIGAYIKAQPKLKSGRAVIPSNVVLLARKWFFGDDLMPIAWRLFAASSSKAVASIIKNFAGANRPDIEVLGRAAVLNIVSEPGEKYPLSFIEWVINSVTSWGGQAVRNSQHHDSLVRFLRLAGREAVVAKKRKKLLRFLREDLNLAWDWFVGFERDGCARFEVKSLQKNATWASIMRSQRAWHAAAEERERLAREADAREYQRWLDARAAACWTSLIAPCLIGDVSVTPLTTGQELLDEHVKMDHCVDRYIEVCVDGRSRIFHLAAADEEATMEIVSVDGGKWDVRQVFGYGNDSASAEMWTAAKNIAKQYSQAAKTLRKAA